MDACALNIAVISGAADAAAGERRRDDDDHSKLSALQDAMRNDEYDTTRM